MKSDKDMQVVLVVWSCLSCSYSICLLQTAESLFILFMNLFVKGFVCFHGTVLEVSDARLHPQQKIHEFLNHGAELT